jgi:hypothetical protein
MEKWGKNFFLSTIIFKLIHNALLLVCSGSNYPFPQQVVQVDDACVFSVIGD